jgi:hypothetical protein
MTKRWFEFIVWAVITAVVVVVDVVLISIFFSRLYHGTLGLWEPRLASIWATTFLILVGGYALHLTNPNRKAKASPPSHPAQSGSPEGQDDYRRKSHDLAGPRIDGGQHHPA